MDGNNTKINGFYKAHKTVCLFCLFGHFRYILTMSKRLTKEGFIEKARGIHGDKYDYSKVNYVRSDQKVTIICPKHGEFHQTPNKHLLGQGCPKCRNEGISLRRSMSKHPKPQKADKQTPNYKDDFIRRASARYDGRYDYSKVIYLNTDTKVEVVCQDHGSFYVTPYRHLNGQECPVCTKNRYNQSRTKTTEEFIQEAQALHGDRYDYSKVRYENNHTKVEIVCPKHGSFWQNPNKHLLGQGCPKCANKDKTTEEFVNECRQVHGDRYDYSKTVYQGAKSKVVVTCKEHGDFLIEATKHLCGSGCKKCSNKFVSDTSTFIERAKMIHGDRYDYSKAEYVRSNKKVTVICPKHGEFNVKANHHLSGVGCPLCNRSKLETELESYLKQRGIEFEAQKAFDWLGKQTLDFYLPHLNAAIECQGIQHFQPIMLFGGDKAYEETVERDKRKRDLCREHGLKLLYYTNVKETPTLYLGDIYIEKDKLIESLI